MEEEEEEEEVVETERDEEEYPGWLGGHHGRYESVQWILDLLKIS